MSLDLIVLGANSAHPLLDRFSSSFVLRNGKKSFLIDAGEGCQIKMSQFKVKRSKISDIFISHLHGDHVFGLPGVITSFNLNRRTIPLSVWGPPGIRKFVNTILDVSEIHLCYDLNIYEIEKDEHHRILDLSDLEVFAFPLQHRIKTYGYLFREKHELLNIRSEKINDYEMSVDEIKKVKTGESLIRNGKVIENNELTYQREKLKSFAYCSDTSYDETLTDILKDVDLLYHEATYTDDLRVQARERMHSTAKEAALIASGASVKKLLIGHFSSRYNDLTPLLLEAQSVFEDSYLAEEGVIIQL